MSDGSAWPGEPKALRTCVPSRMLSPVIPWVAGNAPVPIVACAQVVTAGNEPMIALRKFAPCVIRRFKIGQVSGH